MRTPIQEGWWRWLWPLMMLALLSVSGCIEDEACTWDSECSSGQICSVGECQAGCRYDFHCGVGEQCDAQTNTCIVTDCGDGLCSVNESPQSCPTDCGFSVRCGDGICDAGEACAADCGSSQQCGDGVCGPGASCPADCSTNSVLSVTFTPQSTQVWCWAAVSEMLLRYNQLGGTQCEMASYWLSAPCCPFGNNVPACYSTAPSMAAIQDVLFVGGLQSSLVPRALSWEEVKAQIDSKQPFIIGYTGSFSGHVVVLYGYDSSNNVYIHDPYYGSFVVPYAVSGLYNGASQWTQTIINVRRL